MKKHIFRHDIRWQICFILTLLLQWMVVIVLGRIGLPVISHAEAVKYQGFVNATHPLLSLVDVTAMEHQWSLAAVTTIRANVSISSVYFLL